LGVLLLSRRAGILFLRYSLSTQRVCGARAATHRRDEVPGRGGRLARWGAWRIP